MKQGTPKVRYFTEYILYLVEEDDKDIFALFYFTFFLLK